MRPRLIAVDDGAAGEGDTGQRAASMRPRLIAVDDTIVIAGSLFAYALQ